MRVHASPSWATSEPLLAALFALLITSIAKLCLPAMQEIMCATSLCICRRLCRLLGNAARNGQLMLFTTTTPTLPISAMIDSICTSSAISSASVCVRNTCIADILNGGWWFPIRDNVSVAPHCVNDPVVSM
ncbi:hypothetical protein FBU59_001759 [Linderina macrospora]|uniref:Uncharacterized protein n=1 Tax=Linderina macrospora TaxID=4868 RepID=A0ACC1JCW1_9FUNG|nr:hypothetical protein FBU59_001759 [Linderina macrospora]